MEVNWISIKDKKPEEKKEVLFYSKEWGISLGQWYGDSDYGWVIPDSEEILIDKNVTHWMPLPEEPYVQSR